MILRNTNGRTTINLGNDVISIFNIKQSDKVYMYMDRTKHFDTTYARAFVVIDRIKAQYSPRRSEIRLTVPKYIIEIMGWAIGTEVSLILIENLPTSVILAVNELTKLDENIPDVDKLTLKSLKARMGLKKPNKMDNIMKINDNILKTSKYQSDICEDSEMDIMVNELRENAY